MGAPVFYYFYTRHFSLRNWDIKRNESYFPFVTILVPVYNEEKIIRYKLKNLSKLDYPKNHLQIILIDDCSSDRTLYEIQAFKNSMSDLDLHVLSNPKRMGKTASLNRALEFAKGEIIVVSDADCFWPSTILRKALPFLYDPSVGAVTGLEVLLNPKDSWVTQSEIFYNDAVHTIRVGESKIHSTIFFQGGFGAYKRNLLDKFDTEADDSGTALNIIQKGARTFLLPEAVYFTAFPKLWKEKVTIKIRRASQLVRIWFKCTKLFIQGKLLLPLSIFIPETFLYLVNPFIFASIIILSIPIIFEYPILVPIFLALSAIGFSYRKTKILIIETVQNYLILLCAIFLSVLKRNFSLWTTVRTSRTCLRKEMLEKMGLI